MSELQLGQRVELLPGREDVYDSVFPASRGVVSGRRKDKYGYDLIYIIWDKEHWRYNGEDDLWTLASHFRPVQGEERELIGPEVHEVPAAPPIVMDEEKQTEMDSYMDALQYAAEKASESGAFFFICVKDGGDGHKGIEVLYSIGDPELRNLSIADVLAYAEREMRRKGQ
jgi:hypothetical protein